jgi:hypothetical protein
MTKRERSEKLLKEMLEKHWMTWWVEEVQRQNEHYLAVRRWEVLKSQEPSSYWYKPKKT